jgi:hypothetical protein
MESGKMYPLLNYHQAIELMHKGHVVKYMGTVNGNVWTEKGACFCMCRGVVFRYRDGEPEYRSDGAMVYDPDFRYKMTDQTVDPRYWPKKPDSIKTKLGYSRIGLNNI